jgi:hypothetical protein
MRDLAPDGGGNPGGENNDLFRRSGRNLEDLRVELSISEGLRDETSHASDVQSQVILRMMVTVQQP